MNKREFIFRAIHIHDFEHQDKWSKLKSAPTPVWQDLKFLQGRDHRYQCPWGQTGNVNKSTRLGLRQQQVVFILGSRDYMTQWRMQLLFSPFWLFSFKQWGPRVAKPYFILFFLRRPLQEDLVPFGHTQLLGFSQTAVASKEARGGKGQFLIHKLPTSSKRKAPFRLKYATDRLGDKQWEAAKKGKMNTPCKFPEVSLWPFR